LILGLKKPLPGPGEYQIIKKAGMSKDGKYFYGKLKSSGATVFGSSEREF
jgi:hypothetical protein